MKQRIVTLGLIMLMFFGATRAGYGPTLLGRNFKIEGGHSL